MPDLRSFRSLFLLLLISFICSGNLYSDDLITPTGEDIAAMKSASDLMISPDGKSIVYCLKKHEFDSTAEYSEDDINAGWTTTQRLWIADIHKKQTHEMTRGEKDKSPKWSPDGRMIAFLRTEDDNTSLMVLPVDGGEARPIDTGDLIPDNPQWSPDGSLIAFTAEVPLTEEDKTQKWKTGGVEVFDEEWRASQIWIIPATGSDAKQITFQKEHITEFCWSPDGRQIAYMITPTSSPYDTHRNKSVCIISIDNGEVIKIVKQPLLIEKLSWSPDGRYISFIMADSGLDISRKIRLHDLTTDKKFDICEKNDWTIIGYTWMPDSRSLIVNTIDRTITGLYRVSVEDEILHKFDLQRKVLEWEPISVDDKGRILAFLAATGTEPNAIHTLDLAALTLEKIVDINPQTRLWNLATVEIVEWTNPEGYELDGVLYVTPLAESDSPPPLMVLPHGGPDGVSMEYFSTWAHFFAARGFSVFRPNYRGGIGYGFEFYAANRGRLGEIEWMDIESGVNHLIASGKADSSRMVYGGWSWGGYLTAWAIGHTNRYKVAVVGAGVSDVRSQYVTSDINHGIAAEWEFKGNPWLQPENFEKANPVGFLANAGTPTLILHGMKDRRVDFMQGITLYRALKDVGCEVKFLAFPREPHGFEEPAHDAYMLNKWAEWYDTHLNN